MAKQNVSHKLFDICSWNQSKIGLPDLPFVLPLIGVFTYPFSP